MALKPCKECKKEVSATAKTCPHCGVKDPGITFKDTLTGLAILAVLVWGAITWFSEPEGSANSDQAVAEAGDATNWYEGGTLSEASALEWQDAAYANKLATCADIWAALWNRSRGKLSPEVLSSLKSIDDLRPWADALVNELDAAFSKEPDPEKNRIMYSNQEVTETALLIMVLNKWVNPYMQQQHKR